MISEDANERTGRFRLETNGEKRLWCFSRRKKCVPIWKETRRCKKRREETCPVEEKFSLYGYFLNTNMRIVPKWVSFKTTPRPRRRKTWISGNVNEKTGAKWFRARALESLSHLPFSYASASASAQQTKRRDTRREMKHSLLPPGRPGAVHLKGPFISTCVYCPSCV